ERRLERGGRGPGRPQGDGLLPARHAAPPHRPRGPAHAARGGRDRRPPARAGERRGRAAADPAAGRRRAPAPAALRAGPGTRAVARAPRARAHRPDRPRRRRPHGAFMTLNERTPVWHYFYRAVRVFDPTMLLGLALLMALSIVTMYSAAIDYPGRFDAHLRNLLLSLGVMAFAAHLPLGVWMRAAVPLYVTGVALLVAVALFGDISKGARRWLDIGITRIQPSEILKIATPLMIAWYFQRREGARYWYDFVIAVVLVIVPVVLIARQPDLGTAILVGASGVFVIFLARLPWRVIFLAIVGGLAGLPLLWSVMKEYQKQRVLTLLDPEADPLGKGFHIIQSK